MEENKGHRVTLQTLQPSAKTKGLVGSHGLVSNSNLKDATTLTKPRQKVQTNLTSKIAVFEDKQSNGESKKNKVEDRGVQTEAGLLEATHLVTGDQITVEYWSTIAERRRLALTEALEENEQLHDQVHNITTELESLRAENELLKPLADEAQYLAGVLKDLVGEATSDDATDQQGDDTQNELNTA